MEGHLRALLRDVLCGYLDADLKGVADDILLETAPEPFAPEEERGFGERSRRATCARCPSSPQSRAGSPRARDHRVRAGADPAEHAARRGRGLAPSTSSTA